MCKIKDSIIDEQRKINDELEDDYEREQFVLNQNYWGKLEAKYGKKFVGWLLTSQGYNVDWSPLDWGEPPYNE